MGYSKAEYLELLAEVNGVGKKGKKRGAGVVENSATVEKKRASKFNNERTQVDGIYFDSKKEANRYRDLCLLQRGGFIRDLQRQVAYVLSEGVKLQGEARKKPDLRYIADFVYYDIKTGKTVVEDVKSDATRKRSEYRTKKHLMKNVFGLDVFET